MRYIFSIVREIKYWEENNKLVQFAILSVRSILQLRTNFKHTWVTFYWRSTSLFIGFNFLSWNKIILRIIGFIASFELGVAFNHLSKAVDVIRSKSLCLVTTTSSTSSLNARIFFRGGGGPRFPRLLSHWDHYSYFIYLLVLDFFCLFSLEANTLIKGGGHFKLIDRVWKLYGIPCQEAPVNNFNKGIPLHTELSINTVTHLTVFVL